MTHRSAQPYTSTPVEAFEAATDWVNDLGSPEDFPLPRTPEEKQQEYEAMITVCAAIAPLSQAGKDRVLQWAANVYSLPVAFVAKTTLFVDPVGRDFLYLDLRGGLQATVYVNSGKGQQAAASIGLQINETVVREYR